LTSRTPTYSGPQSFSQTTPPPIRGYLPYPAAALRALSGSGRSGFTAAELLGLRHRDEARVGAHKTPLLA